VFVMTVNFYVCDIIKCVRFMMNEWVSVELCVCVCVCVCLTGMSHDSCHMIIAV